MKKLMIVISFLTFNYLQAQIKNTVSATVTQVNVFYGLGAELTHQAKVNIVNGKQEIILTDISAFADVNTLQIAYPENVILLGHKYVIKTANPTLPQNPVLKRMEDSVKLLQKNIAAFAQETQVNEEQLAKTTKLIETYAAVPEKTINTADIMKLIEYHNGKIVLYRNTLYNLKLKTAETQELINNLYARMAELRKKEIVPPIKTIAQLELQVMAKENTTANFQIIYYTTRAGWIPTYDMRMKSIDNSFKIMYKAMVSQTTGLDWKQAKLTLSTNNPNLGTTIPELTPWNLQFFVPQLYTKMVNAGSYNRVQAMKAEALTFADAAAPNNDDENAKQTIGNVSSYTTLNESQLFTSYEIDLPYDIPTDGEAYIVAIKEEKINATYKHYAIPKLDKDAFLLAAINNWEELNLLPGDANIIMDNMYLGKSFIDPNTTMDTLNLSLGRDKRIALKRILVKEETKTRFIGNQKVETFTYEITVKNNKKEAVNILLKDQYPLSTTKEIEVKLEKEGNAEVNTELGTLNWQVSLEPGEQKKYRFTYTVKYPKDKKIVNIR